MNDDYEENPRESHVALKQLNSMLITEETSCRSYRTEDTMPILWLDPEVQEDSEKYMKGALPGVTKSVHVFNTEEECEECIRQLKIGEEVILIVAGSVGSFIIPRIHDSIQLNAIYVYARHKQYYKKKFKKYVKVCKIVSI